MRSLQDIPDRPDPAPLRGSEEKEWILSKIPMGRTGDAEKDLSGVAVFLASPASDYITARSLSADGGWMAG